MPVTRLNKGGAWRMPNACLYACLYACFDAHIVSYTPQVASTTILAICCVSPSPLAHRDTIQVLQWGANMRGGMANELFADVSMLPPSAAAVRSGAGLAALKHDYDYTGGSGAATLLRGTLVVDTGTRSKNQEWVWVHELQLEPEDGCWCPDGSKQRHTAP